MRILRDGEAARSARWVSPNCRGAPAALVACGTILLLLQCVSEPAGSPPTQRSTHLDERPRAAIVPKTPLPEMRAEGNSSAGVIVLQAGPDAFEAARVVREYFRAVANEDTEQLRALLADSAYHLRNADGDRRVALEFWRFRFAKHDYTAIPARRVFDLNQLEYLDSLTLAQVGEGRELSGSLAIGERLIRVRATETTPKHLFGQEMLFVLAPHGDTFEITAVIEDYDLP